MKENSRSRWMIRSGPRGSRRLKNLRGDIFIEGVERAFSGYEVTHCFNRKTTIIVDWNGHVLRTANGVESFSIISDGMLCVSDLSTEKDGYLSIDSRGADIECRFRAGRSFVRGLASVQMLVGRESAAWGVIDKNGEFVIPPMYLGIGNFTDTSDVAPYMPSIKEIRDGKVWGLINRKGEIVIPPTWAGICEGFFEGRLVAQKSQLDQDGAWGLIDPTGHWAIHPLWRGLSEHVSEQSIGARKGDHWGIIDMSGNWIVEPKFDFCAAYHEGFSRAAVLNSQGVLKKGYLDLNGKWAIEPKYDDWCDFRFGLAEVSIFDEKTDKRRIGYVDTSGHEYWEDD